MDIKTLQKISKRGIINLMGLCRIAELKDTTIRTKLRRSTELTEYEGERLRKALSDELLKHSKMMK